MKKILFVLTAIVLISCGDKKTEEIKLETFDEKLSFSLGALRATDLMAIAEFDVQKLDKDQLMAGFRNGYLTAEQPDCRTEMEGLFGPNGTDFNEAFVTEGSDCIGQIISFELSSMLRGVEKMDQIDTLLLFKGFSEGLIGTDTTFISSEDQRSVDREFGEGLRAKMDAKMQQQYGANKSTGETFLASNTTKPGVITTASGLQYEVVEQGSGAKPGVRDNVECHYHGTLLDGTVFDSSVDRGQTSEFNVSGVIRGWTEVLQLMNEGSKFRVYVPQELAYGANPQPGGPIQPYSALIFDIELVDIK